MQGIKIKDKRQSNNGSFLDFDLKDILAELQESVLESNWVCRDLLCTAIRNEKFISIQEERLKFSGEELIKFANSIHQTIEGRFEAKTGGAAKRPWLIIIAFDSSWFEVWTSKSWVIKKLKERFENVSDISKISAKSL